METKRLVLQLPEDVLKMIETNSTPHTRSAFVEKCVRAFVNGQSERGILERIAEAMEHRAKALEMG